MKTMRPGRQRGAALMALVAVMVLGSSWYLVSRLKTESGLVTAINRARNAQALFRAKQALIAYIAQQAATSGENNPGRLPCPEASNNIGTTNAGISAPWIGPPATSTCSSIGRLPWRTLGLDKLVDSANEPLWYVVGPTWRLTNSSSTLLINSNTTGDITVDGQQVVALIVAPGAAMNVQTAAGCTARNQARAAPSPTMDARDYLECFNSGTLNFVTTAASTSFNDQVVRITAADIMPVMEAVIANRIGREILPALQTVYASASWGFSAGNPVLPFAAPGLNGVINPGPGTTASGASNFQGALGTYQGLLPFNQTQGCTVSAANPRCTTSFLAFAKTGSDSKTGGSGSILTQSTCAWQSNVYVCTGQYNAPSISLSFSFNVTNVAMGLRALDLSKVTCTAVDDVGNGDPLKNVTCSTSIALQSNGSATFTVNTAVLPDIVDSGWGTYANYMINIEKAVLGDHALLSSTNATTGWFARNEWYRLVYYATSPSNTASRLPSGRSCSAATDCMTVTNLTSSSALMVLAGSSVNGNTRPSSALTDYLEANNTTATGNSSHPYVSQTVRTSVATPTVQRFNDRVVVIGSN